MKPVRAPVSRPAIVDVAIELMAEGGLEAVSFRRIAAELGVSAPTLYWHVDSKRHLMDLMAEELLERTGATPGLPAADEPWWEWLRAHASRMFTALIATRDAPLVLAGNRPSTDRYAHLEQVLGILVGAGMQPLEAQQSLFAISSYVIGSATEWQAEAERARAVASACSPAGTESGTPPARALGDHPLLLAAVTGLRAEEHRSTFDHGLSLIIDGLRARYAPPPLSAPAGPADAAARPPGPR
ncbi:MAG: transcriptional regulator, TetR family [Nocardioidaceae bacterium]|nr:transcriptional regulator, TetR family [Nocardioidaceae bacterium]